MTQPLISVVIPAYNAERYIIESIESILKQNDAPSLELIIVDDGSTDNTATLIKNFIDENQLEDVIQLIQQENKGVAIAMNLGLDQAKGTYIAFNDSDDIWDEDKLKRQLEVLESDTKTDMVFGHVKQFYTPELTEEECKKYHCPENSEPAIIAPGMLIRADAFFKVGKFSTEWKKGHFLDWYSRAEACHLTHVMLNDVLYYRRIHTSNMGITMRDSYLDYVRIVKKALQRKRAMEKNEN